MAASRSAIRAAREAAFEREGACRSRPLSGRERSHQAAGTSRSEPLCWCRHRGSSNCSREGLVESHPSHDDAVRWMGHPFLVKTNLFPRRIWWSPTHRTMMPCDGWGTALVKTNCSREGFRGVHPSHDDAFRRIWWSPTHRTMMPWMDGAPVLVKTDLFPRRIGGVPPIAR